MPTMDISWHTDKLSEHTSKRRYLGYERPPEPFRTVWDVDPNAAPAPALYQPDNPTALDPESRPPSTAPAKWAARFRDGLPPPPPPPPPIREEDLAFIMREVGIDPTRPSSYEELRHLVQTGQIPDPEELHRIFYVRRQIEHDTRARQLVPQHLLDTGQRALPPPLSSGYVSGPDTSPRQSYPPTSASVGTRQRRRTSGRRSDPETGYAPPIMSPTLETDRPALLSPSQKRRARRRRAREEQSPQSPEPAFPREYPQQIIPTPLPPSRANGTQPRTIVPEDLDISAGPVHPTYPDIDLNASCAATARFRIDGGAITLTCILKPYPHTGQPHLVQIPPSTLEGASEMFIGWFGPGE